MSNHIENTIYLFLPRYGLCNKLISWAKAYVWARNNHAELRVRGWVHLPLGSILRGDKSWRWYGGFFNGYFLPLPVRNKAFKKITSIHDEPTPGLKLYFFEATPYISDLPELSNYRDEIKAAFLTMIKTKQKKRADEITSPLIGVHIRRGDYVKIGAAIDLSYYVSIIEQLRKTAGKDLPVTIFSDGFASELTALLNLSNVQIFKPVNDLVDLLVLSRSKVLITTKGSSFSYWAAFISDGIVIHHPSTWVVQCRPETVNAKKFEGKLKDDSTFPGDLTRQLQELEELKV